MIPRHIEWNLNRLRPPSQRKRLFPRIGILTPIEVGLFASLIGIGVITILPILFPSLICH